MEHFDSQPYKALQQELAKKVQTRDALPPVVKYVAGADVAYNEQENWMVGAIVILDVDKLSVVEQAYEIMPISFPYIPGLFSFREIPSLLAAYKKLQQKPDLLVCDGHGIAHPKRCGMASHLGVELDIPSIGCAKSRLIGTYEELGASRGDHTPLEEDGEVIGSVLRTQDTVRPLFVSVGHKITLSQARDWVLKLAPSYRQPETTRMADQLVNSTLKAGIKEDYK
jgi:deoxyribonuclease V